MILRRFGLTVLVEEREDEILPIHAADNVFHRLYKKRGVKRSSRKNYKGFRTITFTFKDDQLIDQFMVEVQKEFVKLVKAE